MFATSPGVHNGTRLPIAVAPGRFASSDGRPSRLDGAGQTSPSFVNAPRPMPFGPLTDSLKVGYNACAKQGVCQHRPT